MPAIEIASQAWSLSLIVGHCLLWPAGRDRARHSKGIRADVDAAAGLYKFMQNPSYSLEIMALGMEHIHSDLVRILVHFNHSKS